MSQSDASSDAGSESSAESQAGMNFGGAAAQQDHADEESAIQQLLRFRYQEVHHAKVYF